MTVIVGVEERGLVWLGADSCASNETTSQLLAESKIWRSGAYVVGVSGSSRAAEVIRYFAKLPAPPSRGVRRHIVVEVVPIIQKAMRKTKAIKSAGDWDRGGPTGGEAHGGDILIAVGSHLFSVDQEFSVSRVRDGYNAIGSGADVANGALFATRGMPAKKRIALALTAAAHHACGVRGPFSQMRTRPLV